MLLTKEVEVLLVDAMEFASQENHEFVTPEHVLYILCSQAVFIEILGFVDGDPIKLKEYTEKYLKESMDRNDPKERWPVQESHQFQEMLCHALEYAESSDHHAIAFPHLLNALISLEESYAVYLLYTYGVSSGTTKVDILRACNQFFQKGETPSKEFLKYVTCINDLVEEAMPLIGREEELERTIQILCRKLKNNVVHIGEAGVGKTALIYGLASRIVRGEIVGVLKHATIFSMDLSQLLSGTQYRGDFEQRFQMIMDGVLQYETPILYIDEIHNIIGAGAIGDHAFDVSNLLKPYLASGDVRFIGATTYEEFHKFFARSKSLLRRFQKVDIKEPTLEETIEILDGLKGYYEAHHGVKYMKGTLEHAVFLSDKYITDRYLPDKAIDLIDEAGSYLVTHPTKEGVQKVNKKLIEEVLAKTCRIPKQTIESDERKELSVLEKNLNAQVFGQEEATQQVVGAIKLSRAGLGEEQKPIASFLFVGATGVGKTEIARTLAQVLKIPLVRFDMSEYVEKHSVAKLIGAPAGYVGYEEGGLLTDAVKKTPHCVLLLDEIEKAHHDIFHLLLQVMDYATLTDNKGRKTDFRNVILIMTSNAGVKSGGRGPVGFTGKKGNKQDIEAEIRNVFPPEFRNRLTKVVIFNQLDESIARQIIRKKLLSLKEKLEAKNINLTLTSACISYIMKKGVSDEYGAREIGRVIDQEIKALLVDEMLFGKLKKGGTCHVDYIGGTLKLELGD